jgi:hypothetical protein
MKGFFDYFVYFIILIKIIFMLSAIGHVFLSYSVKKTGDKTKEKEDEKLVYWKERTEFIFTISMSILLIHHFNPRTPRTTIDRETGILFFLFGWVLIITSKWSDFFKSAPWHKKQSTNTNKNKTI